MDVLSETIVKIAMILLWTVELASAVMNRDPVLAALSLFLLLLWVDEFKPLIKERIVDFNGRILLTVLILIAQQTLRFFV